MEYAFAASDERVLAPDFDPSFKEAGEAGAKLGALVKQMPWLLSIMKLLPDSAQMSLNPVMASYIKLQQVSLMVFYRTCSKTRRMSFGTSRRFTARDRTRQQRQRHRRLSSTRS